jgi:hypothetical protein
MSLAAQVLMYSASPHPASMHLHLHRREKDKGAPISVRPAITPL